MPRLWTIVLCVTCPVLAHAEPGDDERRAACGMDVFRFCLTEIPDRARISHCMIENRTQLSQTCRVVVDAGMATSRNAR